MTSELFYQKDEGDIDYRHSLMDSAFPIATRMAMLQRGKSSRRARPRI
jgi:hypothetical protein